MSSKYRPMHDGDLTIIDPKKKVLTLSCCDCALTHDFVFNVTRTGKISFRMYRNNKETKRLRKDLNNA